MYSEVNIDDSLRPIDHFKEIHRWDIEPMPHRNLKVITMISNPIRYKTRYNLYRKFAKHMADSGVDLITCEVQQGERPFAVTDPKNPHHIQLRTYHELWMKECALNICMKRVYELYPDFQYFAWIDADIMFHNPAWAAEALAMLQRYRIVQLWSSAIDLNSLMNPERDRPITYSFGWCYVQSLHYPEKMGVLDSAGVWHFNMGINDYKDYSAKKKPFWHSGYAWAMRRQTYEDLGGPYDAGLFEMGILGSGDHHMALAWIEEAYRSMPAKLGTRYSDLVLEYQNRSHKFVQKDIGYIDGAISHYFHGSKEKRGYRTRWQILAENKFDPTYDIKRDKNGLFMLTDRNIKLRDDIRCYFDSRDEDEKNC